MIKLRKILDEPIRWGVYRRRIHVGWVEQSQEVVVVRLANHYEASVNYRHQTVFRPRHVSGALLGLFTDKKRAARRLVEYDNLERQNAKEARQWSGHS